MREHTHDHTTSAREMEAYGRFGLGMSSLIKCMRAAFVLLAVLIMGMLAWFFTFGGYFTVSPQETILVLRFGKISGQYTEGWHWVFPYPVNTIVRIPLQKQSLKVGKFLPDKKSKAFEGPPEAQGPEGGPLVPGRDGYAITGDANIIHTEWVLNYHIDAAQALKYYTKCMTPADPREPDEVLKDQKTGEVMGARGPATVLRTLLENAVIKVTAAQKVDAALYKKQQDYMRAVEAQFIKEVRDLDIGVVVDSVQMPSRYPPLKTGRAFREVIEAEQESSTEKEKARTYAVEEENSAASESAKIIAEAESYRKRVVAEVKSEALYFEKLLKEYNESPESVLVSLHSQAVTDVLDKVKDKFVISKKEGRQEVRVRLTPEPAAAKKEEENKDNK